MKTETYYAIKIGDRNCRPYFKLGDDLKTPALYATRLDAERACDNISHSTPCAVVRVRVKAQ